MDVRGEGLYATHELVVDVDVPAFVADRSVIDVVVSAARFERCSFRGLRLKGFNAGAGGWPESEYVDCVFDGLRADLLSGRARFERCSFRDVEIGRVIGWKLSMVDCVVTGVLGEATFCGRDGFTDNSPNVFTGNDFSGADLRNTDFLYGVDLAAQRLPNGPEYLYLPDVSAALATLPDDQREALAHLARYSDEGQHQVLLPRSVWGDEVLALLSGTGH